MKKIKKTIVVSALFLFSSFSKAFAAAVEYPQNTGLPDNGGSLAAVLTTLLNWLLGIVGVMAILAFVISGLQYITSMGDEKSAGTAKKNMQLAIIGIIVALSGVIAIEAIDALLRGNSMF